jgi:hypothetical protein
MQLVTTPVTGSIHMTQPSGAQYLGGREVCQRYGIVPMTLHRWLKDKDLGFPEPSFRNRTLRYWLESDLIEWERKRADETRKRASESRSARPTPAKRRDAAQGQA